MELMLIDIPTVRKVYTFLIMIERQFCRFPNSKKCKNLYVSKDWNWAGRIRNVNVDRYTYISYILF